MHRHSKALFAIIIVALVATVGIVYAVSLIQTVPTSPAIGGTAVTTSTCNSATTTLSYPATIPTGPATVVLQCGSNPAFSVVPGGTDTPTFTLPTGATALAISTTVTCTSPTALTSGTQMTLGQTSYYYCLSYSATSGTLATFTINWSS